MNIFNLTQTTEEQRITMALENATEAIQSLRRKLDIATVALRQIYSVDDDGVGGYITDKAIETLSRIESEE